LGKKQSSGIPVDIRPETVGDKNRVIEHSDGTKEIVNPNSIQLKMLQQMINKTK